jgi:hypothetical protein
MKVRAQKIIASVDSRERVKIEVWRPTMKPDRVEIFGKDT